MKGYVKGAAVLALVVGGAWLGFDKGQTVQARADIYQLRAWIRTADYPIVKETWPGKVAIAEIKDGVCKPYPHIVPKFRHVEWVSPQDVPCTTQHYRKPTTPSPALAAIESHTGDRK